MTSVRLADHARIIARAQGLQVGIGAPNAVLLNDAPAGLAAVLRRLVDWHDMDKASAILTTALPASTAARVMSRLLTTGLLVTNRPRRFDDVVRLVGTEPLTKPFAQQLGSWGVQAVVQRFGRIGWDWQRAAPGEAAVTIVVAGTVEPDRAVTATLHRSGEPHLLVRPVAAGIEVGPLVVPGVTPCVQCLDLHCCHHDAEWPTVLAQLSTTQLGWPPALRTWAMGMALTEVRALLGGGEPATIGQSVTCTTTDWTMRWRQWDWHPACECHLS